MKSLHQVNLGLMFMHGYVSEAMVRKLREEQESVDRSPVKPATIATMPQPCCPPPLAKCA